MNDILLHDVQKRVADTAVYPEYLGPLYAAIGLIDESGEVLDKIIKAYFPEPPVQSHPAYELYVRLSVASGYAMGLGKLKKFLRGDNPDSKPSDSFVKWCTDRYHTLIQDEETVDGIASEVGDVSWYAPEVCRSIGRPYGEVVLGMLQKLQDRKQRGVLKGNGDKR